MVAPRQAGPTQGNSLRCRISRRETAGLDVALESFDPGSATRRRAHARGKIDVRRNDRLARFEQRRKLTRLATQALEMRVRETDRCKSA